MNFVKYIAYLAIIGIPLAISNASENLDLENKDALCIVVVQKKNFGDARLKEVVEYLKSGYSPEKMQIANKIGTNIFRYYKTQYEEANKTRIEKFRADLKEPTPSRLTSSNVTIKDPNDPRYWPQICKYYISMGDRNPGETLSSFLTSLEESNIDESIQRLEKLGKRLEQLAEDYMVQYNLYAYGDDLDKWCKSVRANNPESPKLYVARILDGMQSDPILQFLTNYFLQRKIIRVPNFPSFYSVIALYEKEREMTPLHVARTIQDLKNSRRDENPSEKLIEDARKVLDELGLLKEDSDQVLILPKTQGWQPFSQTLIKK
jgi:hypothetical protein